MTRTIEVPEGCKAILVSDQLLARYADWTEIHGCEARVTSIRGGEIEPSDLIVDVQTRYVAPEHSS